MRIHLNGLGSCYRTINNWIRWILKMTKIAKGKVNITWRSSFSKHNKDLPFRPLVLRTSQIIYFHGRFCNYSDIGPLISKQLSVENKANISQLTRADFVTIAEFDTLISKRLCAENKVKLSQLTRANFVKIAKLTH